MKKVKKKVKKGEKLKKGEKVKERWNKVKKR